MNVLSELDPTVQTDVQARFVDDGDLIASAGSLLESIWPGTWLPV